MSFFARFGQLSVQRTTAADGRATDGGPDPGPGDDGPAGDGRRGDGPGVDVGGPRDDVGSLRDHDPAPDGAGILRRVRRVAAWVITALACPVMVLALVAPNQLSDFTPGAFVRLPVEALLGVALVLVLPARASRVAAALVGLALGMLTIAKIVNMGFHAVLDRPFDPVLDWSLFGAAVDFLSRSTGRAGAIGSVVAAVALAAAVLIVMPLAAVRLSRLAVRNRTPVIGGVAVLGVVWVTCAALGVQLVPGVPVATDRAAGSVYHRLGLQVGALRDHQAFADDAFRDTPGDQLLTGLRGKDVMVTFVESYGRVAVEDPQVSAVLDAGRRQLDAAGYASRSGWLTSPTAGGGSWLAQSTLLSGMWIDNQQRYRNLVKSDRLSLNGAFRRANWRTVGVMPAIGRSWPEGKYYGFDQLYAAHDVGYRGPQFSFHSMPDQYTLSAFQRSERATPDHAPVMAEIALLSSHTPWTPVPHLIDWDKVGDGSAFNGMPVAADLRDSASVRTAYLQSVEYSLNTLISYVQTYGNDNLVLVFLGDHQPASIIAGATTSRDVPITIVARDRTVLDRISGWGWQDGLKPGPQAPVWRMDAFRDRFLTAFGPHTPPTAAPPPASR